MQPLGPRENLWYETRSDGGYTSNRSVGRRRSDSAIATDAGLIGDETVIATTVHFSQIFDDGTIPVTEHDFPIDLIVTPDEVIRTGTDLPRPSGVLESHLEAAQREEIPVLRS